MSFTETSEEAPQSRLLLTPTKRRKLSHEVTNRDKSEPAQRPVSQSSESSDVFQECKVHTPYELYLWSQREDAVASCFVSDVFRLQETGDCASVLPVNTPEYADTRCILVDHDYYMLGRVPCKYVRLLGIVVGVDVKGADDEKKKPAQSTYLGALIYSLESIAINLTKELTVLIRS